MTERVIIHTEAALNILAEKTPGSLIIEGSDPVILRHETDNGQLIINGESDMLIQVSSEEVKIIADAEADSLIIIEGFSIAAGTSTDISKIEMELRLASNTLARHKVFTYTGDQITNQKVYTNSTLGTLVYDIDYTYTGDELTAVEVTRVSDNFSYIKTFTYSSGNLISINYV